MTDIQPSVLVVEDEALLLITIADELRDAGFVVYEATGADAALGVLETHPDIGILFTDVDMRGSMDGLRLAAAVRRNWPRTGIIITSGKITGDELKLPYDSVFLAKPYNSAVVVKTVHRLLAPR